jgi:hypothetical protein
MNIQQTRQGCTVTTKFEVTEPGTLIEHVTLECKAKFDLKVADVENGEAKS